MKAEVKSVTNGLTACLATLVRSEVYWRDAGAASTFGATSGTADLLRLAKAECALSSVALVGSALSCRGFGLPLHPYITDLHPRAARRGLTIP